jgi:4-amino-4-deoxy-L-arabinose transferase-like glycosyltransferase
MQHKEGVALHVKTWRFDGWLLAILGLSLILNGYGIWDSGLSNTYYSATVKSMMESFHTFFFASYDPAGFITVDKPPLALWIQTLFALIFGYKGWVLILPQVLAGTGAVALLYAIVKPTFGRGSALLASLVLAITPIAAAVSQTNNLDSMLVFTLLTGAWALFKAVRSAQVGWLLLATAMVGLGFNIKMLQAFMVLPAFYLFYLLAAKVSWRKKLAQLSGATAVLLVVSLSWAVTVDLIPEENRPYIGSSQTNSVLELAFGYNGLSRLTGEGGPGSMMGGGASGDSGRQMPQMPQMPEGGMQGGNGGQMPQLPEGGMPGGNGGQMPQMPDGGMPGGNGGQMPQMPEGGMPGGNGGQMPQMPEGGMPGGNGGQMPQLDPEQMEQMRKIMEEMGMSLPDDGSMPAGGIGPMSTGEAGPLRLYSSQLGGQASWLLAMVLLAALALFAESWKQRRLTDTGREALFWYAWLLPMAAFFSIAGFFHEYYLTMLAPAIAALVGISWPELKRLYEQAAGWRSWLLPAIVLATGVTQVILVLQGTQSLLWAGILFVAVTGVSLLLFSMKSGTASGFRNKAIAVSLFVLLIAPFIWSTTPALYGVNSVLPKAGFNSGSFGPMSGTAGMSGMSGMEGREGREGREGLGAMGGLEAEEADSELMQYLNDNYNGEKYFVAAASNATATPIQLGTDKAVLMYGGYLGNDPALTVDELEEMAEAGEIKFFYVSAMMGMQSDITEWITNNTVEVPSSEWQSEASNEGSSTSGFPGMGGMSKLFQYVSK